MAWEGQALLELGEAPTVCLVPLKACRIRSVRVIESIRHLTSTDRERLMTPEGLLTVAPWQSRLAVQQKSVIDPSSLPQFYHNTVEIIQANAHGSE